MIYQYTPSGVCSQKMIIDVDDNGIIQGAQVIGGCNGNLKGICSLITGEQADKVIAKLKGIRCGAKATSCPDQLSQALQQIVNTQNNK